MVFPTIEQDLELFEKPPPIEPAATISSMGEVAAAVQEADLTSPQPAAEPAPQPEPALEQFVPLESSTAPPVEKHEPQTPPGNVASAGGAAGAPDEDPAPTSS